MHKLNPVFWLAAFFVWALCAGAVLLATAMILYWLRPDPELAEDEWEGLDEDNE